MKTLRTKGEIAFDAFNMTFMILFCFFTLYPVWYIIILSFNDGMDAMRGGIYLWPREFSIEAYKTVLKSSGIMQSYLITILKTVIGVVLHVFFTAFVAYGYSKSKLRFRNFYMTVGVITMFFGGGLIPTFLLIKSLGLLNNFWVYIIPALFSFFDLIIFINFFREIPESLEEAAKIDGANDLLIFFKIILPLSMPVMATIALFHGVYQWNDFFTGMIYVNDANLQPIQTFLYKVIAQGSATQMTSAMPATISAQKVTSDSIKLATMVMTTFPIMCIYPFLQKYFVKGLLIGGVKE